MKIQRRIKQLVPWVLLVLLASCTDDTMDNGQTGGGGHTVRMALSVTLSPIPETKAVVRRTLPGSEAAKAGFSYELVSSDTDVANDTSGSTNSADSIFTPPITKAPSALKNVYALLFTSAGAFNGRANIGTIAAGTDVNVTFTNVVTTNAANCRLVIVANDNTATNSYSSTGGTGGFTGFTGTYTEFQNLTITNTVSTDVDVPYAGSVTVNLTSGELGGKVAIPLYRTLAKITLNNNTFNITSGPERSSITLYSSGTPYFVPRTNNSYNGTGSTQTTSYVPTTTGINTNSNTWYVGENIKPAGSNISTISDRNKDKAPTNACYIRIASATHSAGEFGYSFAYDIYLGKSSVLSDFSLRRHTNYTITSSVNSSLITQEALADTDGRVTLTRTGPQIRIDQAMADKYKADQSNFSAYPPFNYDGGVVTGTFGSDYKGVSSTATISTAYSIEVSKTQPPGKPCYNTGEAKNWCDALGSGWRIPINIELFAMHQNKAILEAIPGFIPFTSEGRICNYWSSSVYGSNAGKRCVFDISKGDFKGGDETIFNNYVRCVREMGPMVEINAAIVASYKTKTTNYTAYPPFNYDGGVASGTTGSDRNGISSTCTLTREYSIEIEMTDRGSTSNYAKALSYCSAKGINWRVPTMIELKAMYDNKGTLEKIVGFADFRTNAFYWSSSIYSDSADKHCELNFSSGYFGSNITSGSRSVRCVRDS